MALTEACFLLGANMRGSTTKAHLFDTDGIGYACRWKASPARIRWVSDQADWMAVRGMLVKLCDKYFRLLGLPPH